MCTRVCGATLTPTASVGVILPDLDETTEHPIEVGWRVYPFPPVFWRRTEVQALNPELIYYGPLPQTRAALRQVVGLYPSPAYVYVIQTFDGDVLYVGKTVEPQTRLTEHRRQKDWWPIDGRLTLLGVYAEDRAKADRVGFDLEAIAIRDLGPIHNIAGVV